MEIFGIDQQGGKGNAAWTLNVAPTILHDSHGTPHAVAYCASFIPGSSAKARSLGYHVETCITLGTMGGAAAPNPPSANASRKERTMSDTVRSHRIGGAEMTFSSTAWDTALRDAAVAQSWKRCQPSPAMTTRVLFPASISRGSARPVARAFSPPPSLTDPNEL